MTERLSQGFFTPAEMAQYLGFSTYTVQDLCRRGELRHIKAGRAIRIPREWADAYMGRFEREQLRTVLQRDPSGYTARPL
jgi:excisionase family DNA binding protein